MTENTPVSATAAIHRVIADGVAMDYVDVVDAVEKKYGLKVSAALVEQLHQEMRAQANKSRVNLEVTAELPDRPGTPSHEESEQGSGQRPADHLGLALRFVKSVGGLSSARAALAELESILERD